MDNSKISLDLRGEMPRPIDPLSAKALSDYIGKTQSVIGAVVSRLEFHEGSERPEFEGAYPTIRINYEDFNWVLWQLRSIYNCG